MTSTYHVDHPFKVTTFMSPTLCCYCGELIWGFTDQGLQCTKCSFTTHHKCLDKITTSCHMLEKRPAIVHKFAPATFSRPYFCNVCRMIVTIVNPGFKCDVCRYVVHPDCIDNAPKNCRQCVSTAPVPTSSSSTAPVPDKVEQEHHWVEGNTPQKGVCEACGLNCNNITCLLNFRCAWCKRFAHTNCVSKINPVCDGGVLANSIIFPKAAIAPAPPAKLINLVDEELPDKPVFVFVNPRSGGQQGPKLLHKLRYQLNNVVQVFELVPDGPGHGLAIIQNYLNSIADHPHSPNPSSSTTTTTTTTSTQSSSSSTTLQPPPSKSGRTSPVFKIKSAIKNRKKRKHGKANYTEEDAESGQGARIVVCGGDGTAGWLLQAMAERGMSVPIGIIPLGTGNDLSRTLGWGPGYTGEDVGKLLRTFEKASVRNLDRWNATFTPFVGKETSNTMTNYFSIGVDAKVALSFHLQREASPDQFKNRFVNFLWYTKFGASAMFDGCENLAQDIILEVDNFQVEIPAKLQGLIVVNLPSYAAGLNMWAGTTPAGTKPQALDDGMVEVVGVFGAAHIAQIQTGLSEGIKIAQGRDIKITFIKKEGPYPVQVDGEPWAQEPGVISISRRDQVPVLINKEATLITQAHTQQQQQQ